MEGTLRPGTAASGKLGVACQGAKETCQIFHRMVIYVCRTMYTCIFIIWVKPHIFSSAYDINKISFDLFTYKSSSCDFLKEAGFASSSWERAPDEKNSCLGPTSTAKNQNPTKLCASSFATGLTPRVVVCHRFELNATAGRRRERKNNIVYVGWLVGQTNGFKWTSRLLVLLPSRVF